MSEWIEGPPTERGSYRVKTVLQGVTEELSAIVAPAGWVHPPRSTLIVWVDGKTYEAPADSILAHRPDPRPRGQ